MRNLMEEAELADQLGLDVFAIGEHHRADFLVSAPAVILAAVAVKTERIRLSSAVTVLSSEDPVRVFQQFAEVDLLSGGRAEIMAGRGSFIDPSPCSAMTSTIRRPVRGEARAAAPDSRAGPCDMVGGHRARLDDAGVWPRPVQERLPVWVAVGGSPQSVVRAGTLGLPLTIAIIGGEPARFAPLVELYRQSSREAGRDPAQTRIAINTHAFIAASLARRRLGVCLAVPGDDEPHRPRARLATVGTPGVRSAARPQRSARGGFT